MSFFSPLIRYDPSTIKDYAVPYGSLVRRVTVGENRVIFAGAGINYANATTVSNGTLSLSNTTAFATKAFRSLGLAR